MDRGSKTELDVKKEREESKDKVSSSSPIVWKLLIPLLFATLILISSFSTVLWWQQDQQMDMQISNTIEFIQDEYQISLEKQSIRMVHELDWIAKNEVVVEALAEKDVDTLLLTSESLYERLILVHHITHFYYQGPDRVNVLRVYRPEDRGGLIDRFTIREAERTGEVVTGIELGSMGTFTLRAVKPVYSNGELVGYIEIGKEIEDILNSVSEKSDTELTVFIYKDNLKRDKWESGMAKLGRNANWDKYSSKVIIYGSVPSSTTLHDNLENEDELISGETFEIEENETLWHTSSISLTDASGEEVGFMLIRQDITTEKDIFIQNLIIITAGSLLIFIALFSLYYYILRRTDQGILENELLLKESISRFRSIIESAHDAVMVVNSKGNIVHWNKSAESMFGYSKDEAFGKSLFSLIPKRYRESHEKKFRGSEVAGRTVEIEGLKKDGTEIPIELSISSWESGDDRYYGGVIRDIAKRKKDELKLKQYASDLERSNDIKNIFTDIMRHDLMNPINFINGYVDVLKNTESDPEKVKKINTMKKATSRLIHMITEASKFSKLDEADEIVLESLDLELLLRSSIMYVKGQLDEKEMSVELNLKGQCFVKANPMIEDVFLNLLSNAIKYSPEKTGIVIDVTDQNDFCKISITYSGEGIEDEDKALIFERFKRVNKGNIKGTGIGLAIVKRVMELHGGELGVEDNPAGQGSRFWITLKKVQN